MRWERMWSQSSGWPVGPRWRRECGSVSKASCAGSAGPGRHGHRQRSIHPRGKEIAPLVIGHTALLAHNGRLWIRFSCIHVCYGAYSRIQRSLISFFALCPIVLPHCVMFCHMFLPSLLTGFPSHECDHAVFCHTSFVMPLHIR